MYEELPLFHNSVKKCDARAAVTQKMILRLYPDLKTAVIPNYLQSPKCFQYSELTALLSVRTLDLLNNKSDVIFKILEDVYM